MSSNAASSETHDPLASLLALVDFSSPANDPEELPPVAQDAGEKAARAAYYGARGRGDSPETATAAAQQAFADAAQRAAAPAPASSPARAVEVAAGVVDAVGAARSNTDRAAAVVAGFAPAEPLFEVGTRVLELGVENATKSRLAFDKLPTVSTACDRVVAKIAGEHRRDVVVLAADIGMDSLGRITDGATATAARISVEAFASLANRLGYGGGQYLSRCRPTLRAENVNDWRATLAKTEETDRAAALADKRKAPEPRDVKLRVRDGAKGGPEIFAAVSKTYPAFDVDKIAAAIGQAAPAGARGTVKYDGTKGIFDVLFHSDVQPKHYVAGEFFKAGVRVRTDDTGGGSAVVSALIWQNLCLNLLVIDACQRPVARIRHVGTVGLLARRFEGAFRKALTSLEHFIAAWGYACEDEVLLGARATAGETVPSSADRALPGLFNGIAEAGLVQLPVRGRADEVAKLVAAWEADTSGAKARGLTRASLVNAFTRYAQTLEDPWAQEEMERGAGALLWGRTATATPAPVPYLSLEAMAEEKRVTFAV